MFGLSFDGQVNAASQERMAPFTLESKSGRSFQSSKRWKYRVSNLALQLSISLLRAANSLANPVLRVLECFGEVYKGVHLRHGSEPIFVRNDGK